MCGRYIVDDETERDIQRLAAVFSQDGFVVVHGDVLPSMKGPVLSAGRRASHMVFGFTGNNGKRLINARAETVLEKPTFASHIRNRRCLMPASGFYEWDQGGRKYTFTTGHTLWLAGFYRTEEDGDHFVILTVPANESMSPVHDRMPLILEEKDMDDWLENGGLTEQLLQGISPKLKRSTEYEQQSLF